MHQINKKLQEVSNHMPIRCLATLVDTHVTIDQSVIDHPIESHMKKQVKCVPAVTRSMLQDCKSQHGNIQSCPMESEVMKRSK
jgi:hypothetical protein